MFNIHSYNRCNYYRCTYDICRGYKPSHPTIANSNVLKHYPNIDEMKKLSMGRELTDDIINEFNKNGAEFFLSVDDIIDCLKELYPNHYLIGWDDKYNVLKFDAEPYNVCIEELKQIARLDLGDKQKYLYNKIYENAKGVKITCIKDLPKEIAKYITRELGILDIRQHECYNNSVRMCLASSFHLEKLGYSISYVEGKISVCGIPIDHAFNKLTHGDKEYYIDITLEKIGHLDKNAPYASINEIETSKLYDIFIDMQNESFPWYTKLFMNQYIKENEEK